MMNREGDKIVGIESGFRIDCFRRLPQFSGMTEKATPLSSPQQVFDEMGGTGRVLISMWRDAIRSRRRRISFSSLRPVS